MNYITRLRKENADLKHGMLMLKRYAQSSKFDEMPLIHRNDVLLLIDEATESIDLTELEEELEDQL